MPRRNPPWRSSKPTSPPWLAALTQRLPGWLRERGADYFRGGRVSLAEVRADFVRGSVLGTDSYSVDLRMVGGRLVGRCTCPFHQRGDPCKHIFAVALAAAEDRRFNPARYAVDLDDDEDFDDDIDLDLDDPDDLDDEDLSPAEARVQAQIARLRAMHPDRDRLSGRAAPRAPEPWRAALSLVTHARDRRPEVTWPEEREIIYVIDVQGTLQNGSAAVSVSWRQRTLKGTWTQPKPVSLLSSQVSTLPDAGDRTVFSILTGARGAHTYNPYAYTGSVSFLYLRAPLDGVLLPLMLGTGRGFLRRNPGDPPSPVRWDPGEPWMLSLVVTEDGTDYVVDASLRRGDESRPLADALLLTHSGIALFGEAAARFEHHGGFAWVLALRAQGALRVPRGEVGALRLAFTRSDRALPVVAPAALDLAPVGIPPRPLLKVARQASDRLSCELFFDYGGGQVRSGEPGWAVFRSPGLPLIARDAGAEAAADERLRALGARATGSHRDLAPSQLAKVSTALLDEGWLLDIEGAIHRAPSALRLRVSSGIDWFDLDGAAEFGDVSLPLATLAAAIQRGDTAVALGHGAVGVIPEDWKRRLALLSSGKATEAHGLRFTRTQAVLLDALLEAQPEVDVDARFEEVRQRLRSFAGVKPEAPPPGFVGELRRYQQEGLGWMRFLREFGFGGILADDMGLGKTVQLLALLESRRAEALGRPSLVVVPKSLVFNWTTESARFAPSLRVLQHTGLGRVRDRSAIAAADVVLTTYGTLRRDILLLKDVAFDYVVLDEAQAVKNPKTDAAKAVRLLAADHRIALSGTPIENHVGELASILEFANPGLLGRTKAFERGRGELGDEGRALLARTIRPFVLRRTKDQVAADLPPRTEQVLHCTLEPPQRAFYDALRESYRQSLLKRVDRDGIGRSTIHVLEALLRLRQAACHVGLVDKTKVDEPSAKIDALLSRLDELRAEGHKALVFSQFTSFLDIVGRRLAERDLRFTRLDGRTRDRAARVQEFQEDAGCSVFLVSLKAGGQGLNLTAASYVFVLDPWWNPAVEAQAIDRTHRIGQTRPVIAYRLIAEDTVEEKVLQLQARKRDLARALITEDHGLIARLGRDDLELLLS